MKVICAWCHQKIENSTCRAKTSDLEISHGICKPCKAFFFTKGNRSLAKMLNRMDAPVIVVNHDARIMTANDQALQFMDKEMAAVCNLQAGDAMECTYARLPQGCGNTVHCAACTIRSNVNKTYKEGTSCHKIPAFFNRKNRTSTHQIRFLITTEKINEFVLLRIEEITEA